jgi:hypothetical protein
MLKVGKHTYFADGQPIIKENLSKVIIGSYCSIERTTRLFEFYY